MVRLDTSTDTSAPSKRHRIVQVVTFDGTGDVYYRMLHPARLLAQQPHFQVISVDYRSPHRNQLVLTADLAILILLNDYEIYPVLEERKSRGRPTVFEINDNFYDVQPWSPVYNQWRDPQLIDQYLTTTRLADCLQVSSAGLKTIFSNDIGEDRIIVFPNHIDDSTLMDIQKKHYPTSSADKTIHLGWGGSLGHMADLALHAHHLSDFISSHTNVHLHIMGNNYMKELFQLAPSQFSFYPWGTLDDYNRFLEKLHIGLIFNMNTPYNNCRSDVKFLEYAAKGLAVLAPPTEPYADTILDDQTGLFFRSTEELLTRLERLISSPETIRLLGQNAHRYVKNERLFSIGIKEREDFYLSLIRESSARCSANEPENIPFLDETTPYIELHFDPAAKPSEPTRANRLIQNVREALMRETPLTPQTIRTQIPNLYEAIEINPHNPNLYYEAARLLLRINQPTEALQVINRRIDLAPTEIRTRFEKAMIHLYCGNDEDAFNELLAQLTIIEKTFRENQRIYFKYVVDGIQRLLERNIAPFKKTSNKPLVSALLMKAISVFPESAILWQSLGEWHLSERDYANAHTAFEKSHELLSQHQWQLDTPLQSEPLRMKCQVNAMFREITRNLKETSANPS